MPYVKYISISAKRCGLVYLRTCSTQTDMKSDSGEQGQVMEETGTAVFPSPYQFALTMKFLNDVNGTGAGRLSLQWRILPVWIP